MAHGKHSSDERYDPILLMAIGSAAISGPAIIIPGGDFAAMATTWTAMATAIANENGVTLKKETVGKIMLSVATGLGAYVGSGKLFLNIVSKIPGIGMVGASATNSVANVVLTVWLGFTLIDLFDQHDGVESLEDHIDFILGAMRPKSAMMKMGGRTAAFLKRQAAAIKRRFSS